MEKYYISNTICTTTILQKIFTIQYLAPGGSRRRTGRGGGTVPSYNEINVSNEYSLIK